MFPRANMYIVHLKKYDDYIVYFGQTIYRTASLQGSTSTFII